MIEIAAGIILGLCIAILVFVIELKLDSKQTTISKSIIKKSKKKQSAYIMGEKMTTDDISKLIS